MIVRVDKQAMAAMEAMINSMASQSNAELGPFWYDKNNKELFGVHSSPAEDCAWYKSSQFGIEVRTGKALHETIWKKEHFRGKDRRFNGNYTLVPRGRVFEFKDVGYVVFTGDWIDNYPEAKDLILFEFNLPKDKTEFRKDSHWDIGHGWSQEFI